MHAALWMRFFEGQGAKNKSRMCVSSGFRRERPDRQMCNEWMGFTVCNVDEEEKPGEVGKTGFSEDGLGVARGARICLIQGRECNDRNRKEVSLYWSK